MSVQSNSRITDISKLIPQRPPIQMIDSFVYDGGNECGTELLVSEDNIFVTDGCLASEGILEHIAQSAAAFLGYKRVLDGLGIALGFIGDIRKCRFSDISAKPGDTLQTNLKIVSVIGNITMISATVCVSGEQIVTCSMKLALEED